MQVSAAQTPFAIRQRASQQGHDLGHTQRRQRIDLRPRQQCRDHLERRILRGRADQDDVAVFHVGQKGVLLRLVEPVNLIDEHNRAPAGPATPLGVRHYCLDLFDTAQHRAEWHEISPRELRNQPRQRRLADAGRSPQNHRCKLIPLHLSAQRFSGPEDMLLADVLVEGLGPHPLG